MLLTSGRKAVWKKRMWQVLFFLESSFLFSVKTECYIIYSNQSIVARIITNLSVWDGDENRRLSWSWAQAWVEKSVDQIWNTRIEGTKLTRKETKKSDVKSFLLRSIRFFPFSLISRLSFEFPLALSPITSRLRRHCVSWNKKKNYVALMTVWEIPTSPLRLM